MNIEYPPIIYITVKVKNGENWSVVIKVRIMVTFGGAGND